MVMAAGSYRQNIISRNLICHQGFDPLVVALIMATDKRSILLPEPILLWVVRSNQQDQQDHRMVATQWHHRHKEIWRKHLRNTLPTTIGLIVDVARLLRVFAWKLY